jgi:predicted nucleotidyltransferase
VDVLVDFAPTVHLSYFDMIVIRETFESLFGRHVDMVEKAAIKNPIRRQGILFGARVVYAA